MEQKWDKGTVLLSQKTLPCGGECFHLAMCQCVKEMSFIGQHKVSPRIAHNWVFGWHLSPNWVSKVILGWHHDHAQTWVIGDCFWKQLVPLSTHRNTSKNRPGILRCLRVFAVKTVRNSILKNFFNNLSNIFDIMLLMVYYVAARGWIVTRDASLKSENLHLQPFGKPCKWESGFATKIRLLKTKLKLL